MRLCMVAHKWPSKPVYVLSLPLLVFHRRWLASTGLAIGKNHRGLRPQVIANLYGTNRLERPQVIVLAPPSDRG